jgi:hypothetical protein
MSRAVRINKFQIDFGINILPKNKEFKVEEIKDGDVSYYQLTASKDATTDWNFKKDEKGNVYIIKNEKVVWVLFHKPNGLSL